MSRLKKSYIKLDTDLTDNQIEDIAGHCIDYGSIVRVLPDTFPDVKIADLVSYLEDTVRKALKREYSSNS